MKNHIQIKRTSYLWFYKKKKILQSTIDLLAAQNNLKEYKWIHLW
jgi:hypothetical protein